MSCFRCKIDNNKYYAIKFADIVTQSFHPVKHITTGEGGAVITNNKDIYEKVKSYVIMELKETEVFKKTKDCGFINESFRI